MTYISIFCIVLSEFCHKKELGPSILFIIDKNLEVSFYYIILLFGLAIKLKVESNRKSLLNFKEIV